MDAQLAQFNNLLADPVKGKIVILLLIWSFVWKGIALWKAGRNRQPIWFLAMFILNTVGVLEILYIGFFQKRNNN